MNFIATGRVLMRCLRGDCRRSLATFLGRSATHIQEAPREQKNGDEQVPEDCRIVLVAMNFLAKPDVQHLGKLLRRNS